MTDDTTPVGFYPDGFPMYAPTEVDARFETLLDTYSFTPGDPDSERMAVANALSTVIAPEYLAYADQAVEVLRQIATREPHPADLKQLLRRYGNDGPNPDRRTISRGFAVVIGNGAHAGEAVNVLAAMVDLAQRRATHLAEPSTAP